MEKLRKKLLDDKKVFEHYYKLLLLDIAVKTMNSVKRAVSLKTIVLSS